MRYRRPDPERMTHAQLVDEVLELRAALDWHRGDVGEDLLVTRVLWWSPTWSVDRDYAVKYYGPSRYGWARRFASQKADEACMVRVEQAPLGEFRRKWQW